MRNKIVQASKLLLVVLLIAGCGATHQAKVHAPSPQVRHIIWVIMENHSYGEIIGSSDAPYINSLAAQYGSLTNMYATTHPSLPNYIALTSGSPQGIGDDSPPSAHPLNVPNIFQQLPMAQSLEESMPSPCAETDAYPFAIRHDPEAYYINLSRCTNFPLGTTYALDLSPPFTLVTPNVQNDMHDGTIAQGDAWLKQFVPRLLDSPQYTEGDTAIFITWDEGFTDNNHIATLVIDPWGAHTVGGCADTKYTHYSLLRYVENTFNLPLLGGAQDAPSLAGCFGLP